MTGRERVVVLGQMSEFPVAGVVWQTIHYLLGFERLGYETYYVETHGASPHMFMSEGNDGSELAAAFLDRVMARFGLSDRWAFHALHSNGEVFGRSERELRSLLGSAALLVNLCGCTDPGTLDAGGERLVYIDTDPGEGQIEVAQEVQYALDFLSAHQAIFTFAENLGNADCGLPAPERFLYMPTRQPVVLELWEREDPLPDSYFTTVASWRQEGGIVWQGTRYSWSKHHEFAKFIDLPERVGQRFELAVSMAGDDDLRLLERHGWRVRDGREVSGDANSYRDYIGGSRGEFTVAKDQNVRLRTGWFSDRSATYLAAGRPVITQDTGFGSVLPTGEGLFPFSTADEVVSAIERIDAEPERHRRAALEIAREYFSHEIVLGRLLEDLGMSAPALRRGGGAAPTPGLSPATVIQPRSYAPTTLVHATEAAVLGSGLPSTDSAADRTGVRPPRASIAVVTYNGIAFTRMALESVLANTPAGCFELIVVDNASDDGTPFYLRALAAFNPAVRVVLNRHNRGFAAATNQALALASGEVLVLLNNDTIVPDDWLDLLLRHLEDPAVGLVGPVTNEAPNEASVAVAYRTYGEMRAFARERARELSGRAFDIPMLTMFCTALRRSTFEEVGELDERYEVGLFEDEDYAHRVRLAGKRVICAEDVFVHHFGAASFGKLKATGNYRALLEANRERFEEKWRIDWNGHASGAYKHMRDDLRRLVADTVPDGAIVAVVSHGDEELLELGNREAWHFPRARGGDYLGRHPEHSGEAIRRLEQQRELGADFLVVPEPSEWWLEHYAGFAEHLRDRHEEIGRGVAGVVFALRRELSHVPSVSCCIAGMHRSGTSMVAAALAAGGLWLGDPADLFEASPDNPRGYWEHRRFVELNEALLDCLGGSWDCPPSLNGDLRERPGIRPLREQADELATEFPFAAHWGWKDPRNSLTLPFWREVIPELRVVICVRHPLAVAESLHRRAMLSRRLSLSLWLTYNECALRATRENGALVVGYERVLADPETELRRMLAFLALDPTTERIKAGSEQIDRGLHRAATPSPDDELPDDVGALYSRMRTLSAIQPS